jgi:hypothetical protein
MDFVKGFDSSEFDILKVSTSQLVSSLVTYLLFNNYLFANAPIIALYHALAVLPP